MVGIDLPENPDVWKIVVALFAFGVAFFSLYVNYEMKLFFWIFVILGTIMFVWGIKGLNEAAQLKDKKIKHEIELLKIQQEVGKRDLPLSHPLQNHMRGLTTSLHEFGTRPK